MDWMDHLPFAREAQGLWNGGRNVADAVGGKRPVSDERDAWWGSSTRHRDAETGELAGLSLRLGMDPIDTSNEDASGSLQLFNWGMDAGAFTDPSGGASYGLNVSAGGLRFAQMERADLDRGPRFIHGAELGVNEGALQAYAGESGAALGVQANILSGAFIRGTAGTDIDEVTRVGASLGEGAALRGHWGDDDRDGNTEWGFGFDVGPLSMDFKTEDPVFSALHYLSLGTFGGADTVQNHVHGLVPERANYTHAIGDAHASVTDRLAGVEGTSGTRGGVKTFGDMSEGELLAAAMFNPGMNADRRAEILSARGLEAFRLFGGQY
jgi:hypothetical protein